MCTPQPWRWVIVSRRREAPRRSRSSLRSAARHWDARTRSRCRLMARRSPTSCSRRPKRARAIRVISRTACRCRRLATRSWSQRWLAVRRTSPHRTPATAGVLHSRRTERGSRSTATRRGCRSCGYTTSGRVRAASRRKRPSSQSYGSVTNRCGRPTRGRSTCRLRAAFSAFAPGRPEARRAGVRSNRHRVSL